MPDIELSGNAQESDVKHALDKLSDEKLVEVTGNTHSPMALTALNVLADYLKGRGLTRSARMINTAPHLLLKWSVPENRERAKEMIGIAEAASGSAAEKKERDALAKALGNVVQ